MINFWPLLEEVLAIFSQIGSQDLAGPGEDGLAEEKGISLRGHSAPSGNQFWRDFLKKG